MPYLPPGSSAPTALPTIPRTKHRHLPTAPLQSLKQTLTTAEDILAAQLARPEGGKGEKEHDPPSSFQEHDDKLSRPRSLSIIPHDMGGKTPDCEHVEHAPKSPSHSPSHSPLPPVKPYPHAQAQGHTPSQSPASQQGGDGQVRKVPGESAALGPDMVSEMEAAVEKDTGVKVEIKLASREKDAVSMYSEAIYAYTHSLYLQAKTSSSSTSSSGARGERKKTGNFGSKMSGMEKMAQQKALAARLNG
ncbi:hypothetical protein IAR50_001700 [Cryptococcus sp. DSM 104548]